MDQVNPSIDQEAFEQQQSPNRRNRIIGGVIAGVAVVGLAIGVSRCGDDGESAKDGSTTTVAEGFESDVPYCEDFTNVNAAKDGNLYTETAFLPMTDATDAQKVVDGIFDQDGPLAGKGDFSSLGAFMATIGGPANDGNLIDPNYNYGVAFQNIVARYNQNGLGVARQDCDIAYKTAREAAVYEEKWVTAGTTLTEIQALRNADNLITGMKLSELVTAGDIDGVVFRLPKSSTQLDEFVEVMYETKTGKLFVKGVTTGIGATFETGAPAVSIDEDTETTAVATTEAPSEDTTPVETTPDDSDETTPTGTNPTNNDNGGSNGTGTTGGNTGGGTGTTGGNNGGGGGSGGSGSGDCGSDCGTGGEDGEEPAPTTATPTTKPAPVTTTTQPTTTTTRPPVPSSTTTTTIEPKDEPTTPTTAAPPQGY